MTSFTAARGSINYFIARITAALSRMAHLMIILDGIVTQHSLTLVGVDIYGLQLIDILHDMSYSVFLYLLNSTNEMRIQILDYHLEMV